MARKSVIDFGSETWKALVEKYETRLDDLRKRNDGDLSDIQTAKLRGRIHEIREFLALAKAPEQVADEDQNPLRCCKYGPPLRGLLFGRTT